MQITKSLIAFGFTALVSAIDVELYDRANCGGTTRMLVCTNLNPGVCCYGALPTGGFSSVYYRYIPSNWRIQAEGSAAPQCNGGRRTTRSSNGNTGICISDGGYGGGGYSFVGRKRMEVQDEKKECVRADVLRTEDGKEYPLAGLSEEKFNEVVNAVYNVTDGGYASLGLLESLQRLK